MAKGVITLPHTETHQVGDYDAYLVEIAVVMEKERATLCLRERGKKGAQWERWPLAKVGDTLHGVTLSKINSSSVELTF